MQSKIAFSFGLAFGIVIAAVPLGLLYSSTKTQLASTKDRLSEVENFSSHMEKMRDDEAQRAMKAETKVSQIQGRQLCISTYDMPGVRHGVGFYVREWTPRPDGACNSADAPAEGVWVLGDDYRGGELGCVQLGSTVTWRPRADGFCYVNDIPK